MAFAEKLRRMIDSIGDSEEIRTQIVARAREQKPHFSMTRLVLLLSGHPPLPSDRKALAAGLEVHLEELLDDRDDGSLGELKVISNFVDDKQMSGEVDRFTTFILATTEFRGRTLTWHDLEELWREFWENRTDD